MSGNRGMGAECQFDNRRTPSELYLSERYSEIWSAHGPKEKRLAQQLPAPGNVPWTGRGMHRRKAACYMIFATDRKHTVQHAASYFKTVCRICSNPDCCAHRISAGMLFSCPVLRARCAYISCQHAGSVHGMRKNSLKNVQNVGRSAKHVRSNLSKNRHMSMRFCAMWWKYFLLLQTASEWYIIVAERQRRSGRYPVKDRCVLLFVLLSV